MERISVSVMTVMSDKGIDPFRVQYENNDGINVIKINRIIQKDKSKISGTITEQVEYKFKCETVQGGRVIPFTLIYHNQSGKWQILI